MAIDGIGWDWSYMANEEENHALVVDDEVPTEFALMAKSGLSLDNEVKKEKESLDNKLIGFENASKDLDNLLESQRSDKNKEGLGYNAVPPLLHKSIRLLRKICLRQDPQQNRVAERRNRTLIEAAKTMLADAKLPVTFWAEAVNTACYVQNKVLVNKSQNKTPYELFNSRIPAIGFLGPFGCHIMIFNTLDNLGKFDAKGDEGYFVRYSLSSKAFRVHNKRTNKVEKNLHVEFLENKLIKKGAGSNWLFDIDTLTNLMNYVPVVVAGTSSTNISDDSQKEQDCNADVLENSGIFNPTATSKVPSADQVEPAISLTVAYDILTVSSPVPTVCLDISPKSSSGSRLIPKGVFSQKETPSLGNDLSLSNRFEDTFEDVTNAVDLNEVEADLSNMETSIPVILLLLSEFIKIIQRVKNKARLVAQGYTQEEGIDYEEVFALVVRIEAIRLFLAYALFMGFIVYQMDVKSAFLYGTIDEEVYVMQPLGFQDPEFPERVYKVEKAMYGLHQAPRAWYGTLSKYLLDNGFQRGTTYQTLFIRKHKGEFLLGQVYVDDIIFRSSNLQLCIEFKALMHDKFQMSAMGKLTFFLSLQVLQKKDGIFLSQDKYVGDILKKFRYSNVRHQMTPKECHLHVVKRTFRYLKSHPKLGLWYPKDSSFNLVAYSDSDYGGATQDRKSTTRGCQFLGRRLISWQCKKQTIVATSTTKVEYVAAASGCGQVFWIQNQMLDYGIETTDQETKIIAIVDGKSWTISESSLRRHLKLNDEEGISSLPDAEVFENL
uniref:Putative ribonuclease H-like domain-containing protein n=1 Tax=Tanacetum cinerariifolium TaxID=118510 RepID=A0A6L2MDR6_TANCI|nr:putative ribonuclease H-like domain-containing protein [Tanacetum cinerariifolium]